MNLGINYFDGRCSPLGSFANFLACVIMALCGAMMQSASAQTPTPLDLVRQAVAAQGGADALRNIKRLSIKGDVRHWEPEESYAPGGQPVFTDHSTFVISWDLEHGMARTDWDRAIQFPAVTHDVYSEVVTPLWGYADVAGTSLAVSQSDLPPKGPQAMSGIRIATHLRELDRAAPTLLLQALDNPESLRSLPNQTLGGGTFEGAFGGFFPAMSLPAVALTERGAIFTILFDPKTHLPAAIRTVDDDALLGDSNYDLILSDWHEVDGVQIAHSLTYTLANMAIEKAHYTDIVPNPSFQDSTFAISDAVRAAAKPPALENVPYQWVIRRLNFNRFPDSDAVNVMPGGKLKLVELAPNVQQVVGGSHNGLIVSMQNYLVIFDAPINEWQSHFTIEAAKARYPGKAVKYVVLTHHHTDHAGGVRTYVSEGTTVIVPKPDKEFFAQVFRASHTVVPDDLQKHPRPADIIEVSDTMTLKDESGEITLFNIANPHAEGMLVGYIKSADIMWVTDLYSPERDRKKSPAAVNFYETLKKLDVQPARFAGGHGSDASYAEFEAIEK